MVQLFKIRLNSFEFPVSRNLCFQGSPSTFNMDIRQTVVRVVCCVFTAFELLSLEAINSVHSSSDTSKLSQLKYYSFSYQGTASQHRHQKRRDVPPTSTAPPIPHKELEGIKRDTTLALEYIGNVSNNRTFMQQECLENRTALILSKYNLRYNKSQFYQLYGSSVGKVVDIANILTNFFTNHPVKINKLNDTHMLMLVSHIRYMVENDTNVAGCGIAFENGFFPYVAKNTSGRATQSDLGSEFQYMEADFFTVPKSRNYSFLWKSGKLPVHRNNSAYLGKLEGFWSDPYYDCMNLYKWILTYSAPFFHVVQGSRQFSGVVMIDIDLNKTDVNQCSQELSLFSNSDKCQLETTQCEHNPYGGLALGNYVCMCRKGFYFPQANASQNYFSGHKMENVYLESIHNNTNFSGSLFQCLPCLPGCDDCVDNSPCLAEFDILLRGIPLGIQSFCITVTLVIGIAVIRLRKTKVMVSGMWILLEIILFGAVLLYATVIIQYFEPKTTLCLIIPWFRELGFAIVYGSLLLKVYRLLAEFQSRKAHRVHVRDKDLLKYLCCIIVVVLGFMSAWVTVTLDHMREGKTILEMGVTPDDNLKYYVCKSGWWDYVIEVAELLFLCFGIYLCYRVRAAPSDYSEGTYVSAAICYEALFSTVFYVLRHVYWLNLHPDFLFLMSFLRCQLTVTVTLLLLFGPKLLYAHRPPENQHIRNRAYSSSDVPDNMGPETMKLNIGISSNGDVDVGEISLADMDPEDIRAELKRLYTQLQIYKTRTMRKDNRHISKRRGGRKQTHRRFSLQPFHHKHRHHHDHEHDHEMSKTPEESTNSAEAVPVGFESVSGNKCDDVHENEGGKTREQCTVTFKMGHK